MLRACVLEFKGSWDEYIALMEFAYNNQHHSSIGMAPYEALYGRKCRNPVCWDKEGIPLLEGPDLIQDTVEKVKIVKSRLKATQDRQKRYIDQHRREMEYEVGENVFLRVSPIGKLAYKLELPAPYAGMHDVFHVSRLKKYQPDPEHIITRDTPPLMENLSYTERLIRIIDQQVRQLRKREIPMVKVVWQNHNRDEDATWEMEEDMRNQYLELF
ncbi:hypothetical protein DH2020_003906 [Rehmannia glutinosa]|uniref:Tf2-1-like SH3-like domain-containing protein n=1 Tax=Rehmannia glutinosa TaxID=99300 RepID=A0ABR0XMZ4_REHGL